MLIARVCEDYIMNRKKLIERLASQFAEQLNKLPDEKLKEFEAGKFEIGFTEAVGREAGGAAIAVGGTAGGATKIIPGVPGGVGGVTGIGVTPSRVTVGGGTIVKAP